MPKFFRSISCFIEVSDSDTCVFEKKVKKFNLSEFLADAEMQNVYRHSQHWSMRWEYLDWMQLDFYFPLLWLPLIFLLDLRCSGCSPSIRTFMDTVETDEWGESPRQVFPRDAHASFPESLHQPFPIVGINSIHQFSSATSLLFVGSNNDWATRCSKINAPPSKNKTNREEGKLFWK